MCLIVAAFVGIHEGDKELQQLQNRVTSLTKMIGASKEKMAFMHALHKNPAEFVVAWVASQTHDRGLMTEAKNGAKLSNLKRSSTYFKGGSDQVDKQSQRAMNAVYRYSSRILSEKRIKLEEQLANKEAEMAKR